MACRVYTVLALATSCAAFQSSNLPAQPALRKYAMSSAVAESFAEEELAKTKAALFGAREAILSGRATGKVIAVRPVSASSTPEEKLAAAKSALVAARNSILPGRAKATILESTVNPVTSASTPEEKLAAAKSALVNARGGIYEMISEITGEPVPMRAVSVADSVTAGSQEQTLTTAKSALAAARDAIRAQADERNRRHADTMQAMRMLEMPAASTSEEPTEAPVVRKSKRKIAKKFLKKVANKVSFKVTSWSSGIRSKAKN